MSAQMYYLETGSLDPAYNLAFEEVVLRRRTRGDYLLLWQNDNTVVVGQNQNAEAEIDRAFVEDTANFFNRISLSPHCFRRAVMEIIP